jgi:hypothetical protein
MYRSDWMDVERVARQTGIKTRSGAMRIIMQQWRESRAAHDRLAQREGQTPPRA